MTLCDYKNEVYLFHQGNLRFEDNTLYFIIGKSGHGKTSVIDFITAPFTEDPIKNGTIEISGINGKESTKEYRIENSYCLKGSNSYYKFVRNNIAFIPQKTDSFHPKIPVSKQMFDMYRKAANQTLFYRLLNKKKDLIKFEKEISDYSKKAGWKNVSTSNDSSHKNKSLDISENSGYLDGDKFVNSTPDGYIGNYDKIWEHQFSSGQKQRMLILNGLLQFSVMKAPVLVADEFLVNFSYQEANDVLGNIIDFFSTRCAGRKNLKGNTGIFILHDLSFPVIQNLKTKKIPDNLKIKTIVLERKPISDFLQYNAKFKRKFKEKSGELFFHEIALRDFLEQKWENGSEYETIFKPFVDSYSDNPIKNCQITLNTDNESIYHKILVESSPADRPNLYAGQSGEFELTIRKNRFVVITGFSGVGKSTFCEQILRDLVKKEKKNFRYMPAHILSAISEDGNSTVYQDLSFMYDIFNGIKDINKDSKIQDEILSHIRNVRLLDTDYSLEFNGLIKRRIFDFSGGQQQRYWLSRILLDHFPDKEHVKPELLVLDESIASLDCQTKNSIIQTILEDYFYKNGYTILFISHDRRDISVIYNTFYKKLSEDYKSKEQIIAQLSNVFEHYEIFNGMLYQLITPYTEFIENQEKHIANEYATCQTNEGSTPIPCKFFTLPEEKEYV